VSLVLTLATIRIPRTCQFRREPTYAMLIRRVNRRKVIAFEGRYFRTGVTVDERELRPTLEWPEIPLLIEYAGSDRTGRGHRRSRDIHVLWKFEIGQWVELARVSSQGPEWVHHLKPIVLRELRVAPVNYIALATDATGRVLALLDAELDAMDEDEGRERIMFLLYDRFTARLLGDAA
jgi:hypothetical protein